MEKTQNSPLLLLPFDFSEHAESALNNCVSFVDKFGFKVMLLFVYSEKMLKDPRFRSETKNTFTEKLKNVAAIAKMTHGIDIDVLMTEGDFVKRIPEVAIELGVTLIIMGVEQKQQHRRVYLSDATKIVEHSPVPLILLHKESSLLDIQNLLFTMSVNTPVRQKAEWTLKIAEAYQSKISILKVKEGNDEDAMKSGIIEKQLVDYFTKYKVDVAVAQVEKKSKFGEQVLQYAYDNKIDLITIIITEEKLFNFSWGDYDEQMIYNQFHIPIMLTPAKQLNDILRPWLY